MSSKINSTKVTSGMDASQQPRWEHFSHDADMGVRGWGDTPAAAFEQAALALTALVTTEPIAATVRIDLRCEAPDLEVLLVDWLNSLVFEMATRGLLFSRFRVRIEDHRLEARAWGEPVDVIRHQPVVEVKGATFTALMVTADESGRWRAQCVVDV